MAEKLFELDVTSYPELTETENELKVLDQIYGLYVAHVGRRRRDSPPRCGRDLDFAKLVDFAKDFRGEARGDAGDGLGEVADIRARVRGHRVVPLDAARDRVAEVGVDARETLGATPVGHRHELVNTDPNVFTLGMLLGMKIHLYSSGILDMCTAAEKEVKIEADIVKLADVWKHQKFELLKYVKGEEDRGFTLRSTDEVTVTLDDMALTLQSMMSSRYAKPFIDDVRAWEAKLSLISEVIEVWNEVQRKWMYLESIFIGSDDIRHQLPEEAKRFDRIEKHWQMLMADTNKNSNILDACSVKDRLPFLQELHEQLELCQKSLSEYLDTKRNAFPRFFFISDDELLQILGTSDPTAVQEHMLKLFDNTARAHL